MRPLIALTLLLCLTGPLAAANPPGPDVATQLHIARQMVNDQRNTLLAYNMRFTQEEKEQFWPLYREYRAEMNAVGDKRIAAIVEYAEHVDSMTDRRARDLLERSFAIEKERIRVKERYVKKFSRILPDTKVTRLMQLEHRMDTSVDVKIAEAVPLME